MLKQYKILTLILFLTGVFYVTAGFLLLSQIGFLIVFLAMFAIGSTVTAAVNAINIWARSQLLGYLTAIFNTLVMSFCVLYVSGMLYSGAWPIAYPLLLMMIPGGAVTFYSFSTRF